jgi:hypothetical protein
VVSILKPRKDPTQPFSFDTVWVIGLLYKFTILNFLSFLVKTISYLHCRTLQMSFQWTTSTRRNMRTAEAQGGLLFCAVQSVCKRHTGTSHHVELSQNADDTALIATSHGPSLLVSYLDTYLSRSEHWLWDWRNAINISKDHNCALLRPRDALISPDQSTFSEPIQWVETARYLWATLDTQLTWSAHVSQGGKKGAQRLGVLGPLLNRRKWMSIKNGVLLYK